MRGLQPRTPARLTELDRFVHLQHPGVSSPASRPACSAWKIASETPPHVVQRILNHADRGIAAQVYNQYPYAKEIEVAQEMPAGKVREGVAADPAQGVVVLAEYKGEKMAAATNG